MEDTCDAWSQCLEDFGLSAIGRRNCPGASWTWHCDTPSKILDGGPGLAWHLHLERSLKPAFCRAGRVPRRHGTQGKGGNLFKLLQAKVTRKTAYPAKAAYNLDLHFWHIISTLSLGLRAQKLEALQLSHLRNAGGNQLPEHGCAIDMIVEKSNPKGQIGAMGGQPHQSCKRHWKDPYKSLITAINIQLLNLWSRKRAMAMGSTSTS